MIFRYLRPPVRDTPKRIRAAASAAVKASLVTLLVLGFVHPPNVAYATQQPDYQSIPASSLNGLKGLDGPIGHPLEDLPPRAADNTSNLREAARAAGRDLSRSGFAAQITEKDAEDMEEDQKAVDRGRRVAGYLLAIGGLAAVFVATCYVFCDGGLYDRSVDE